MTSIYVSPGFPWLKVQTNGAMNLVLCRLYPLLSPATTAVFGSSLYSMLALYSRFALAYTHDWRGFVGAKNKTSMSISVFNSSMVQTTDQQIPIMRPGFGKIYIYIQSALILHKLAENYLSDYSKIFFIFLVFVCGTLWRPPILFI